MRSVFLKKQSKRSLLMFPPCEDTVRRLPNVNQKMNPHWIEWTSALILDFPVFRTVR